MSDTIETFTFQTEARQLLDLMIHSVYSNKDIFLRELISNASDALDKRRFEALQNPGLHPEGVELEIRIEHDPEARTLTVADTGIGMSRQEVVDLIGTIAKSGTKEFLKHVREAKSKGEGLTPDLIGQFGVGFYSTFMVADKVSLLTRHAGEETATLWESSGDGTYTLQEAARDTAGTTVTLHLKPADSEDGLHDYTEEWQIRQIVKQYSDFVAYPIKMDIERTEVDRDGEGKPVEGAEERKVIKSETLNSMKAIWLRDKDGVTEDEYNEFYKHIGHDWNEPQLRIQAKIEGTLEYRMLLYVPSTPPFDLYWQGRDHHGVHLYIKRVFIMDDCKALLPNYLRFLRGVVDSEDLSLNISREMLQQNRQIQRMAKGITNKVLAELAELRDKDTEGYGKFWTNFGRVLKEGLIEDHENQTALLELARFGSTHDPEKQTSLKEYIERMKPGQECIYYMTGETRKRVEQSPHLEAFRDKGYEVIILCDPVDEVWAQSVDTFEDKELKSIGKGAVELPGGEEKGEAEETRKKQKETFGSLLEAMQKHLEDHVKEVRLSNRLTSSAACLVSGDNDLSPQLEQMMRAAGQSLPETKRILEVNPGHPLIEKLQEVFEASKEDARLKDYAQLLHGQALLAEGGELADPGNFSRLVAALMLKAI